MHCSSRRALRGLCSAGAPSRPPRPPRPPRRRGLDRRVRPSRLVQITGEAAPAQNVLDIGVELLDIVGSGSEPRQKSIMRAAARAARGLCSDAGARKEAPGKAAGTRVNAWLARQGVCSRAEADDLIARGLVRIDGEEVALGARVPEDVAARIRVAPEGQRELDGKRTFLLHKPKGIVSGTPTGDEIPAVRLLEDLGRCAAPPEVVEALSSDPDYLKGVAPCGRLDKDSSGLLVLTQSGVVASRLLARKVEKEYLVRVTPRRRITDEVLRQLREGHLQLDRRQLRPCTVQRTENPDVLRFILEEGRNRQIRRMCKLVGLHVVDLGRIRIGDIVLNLKRGEWRTLLPDEKF